MNLRLKHRPVNWMNWVGEWLQQSFESSHFSSWSNKKTTTSAATKSAHYILSKMDDTEIPDYIKVWSRHQRCEGPTYEATLVQS